MPETQNPLSLEAIQINDNSYRIEDNGVRAFLFIGSERALLVDTCLGNSGSLKTVVESLTKQPVLLAITHADGDHIGFVHEFPFVYLHPSEMAHYTGSKDQLPPAKPLWEGDVIDIGGMKFKVILIPGHTPGSIALLCREKRFIITGDSVSTRPVFLFGEERNVYAYIESINKLISLRGTFDTIYPSHGIFPLGNEHLDKTRRAAIKLLAGELKGEEPDRPVPAKMYMHDGAGFFY